MMVVSESVQSFIAFICLTLFHRFYKFGVGKGSATKVEVTPSHSRWLAAQMDGHSYTTFVYLVSVSPIH